MPEKIVEREEIITKHVAPHPHGEEHGYHIRDEHGRLVGHVADKEGAHAFVLQLPGFKLKV